MERFTPVETHNGIRMVEDPEGGWVEVHEVAITHANTEALKDRISELEAWLKFHRRFETELDSVVLRGESPSGEFTLVNIIANRLNPKP